jgi:hypothetical protein
LAVFVLSSSSSAVASAMRLRRRLHHTTCDDLSAVDSYVQSGRDADSASSLVSGHACLSGRPLLSVINNEIAAKEG